MCDSVRRIMRSLPELKQYQVITVADTVRYPMKGEGEWLAFDPAKTPDEVYKNLVKIIPASGTNLYAGLEAAFKYSDKDLSAVYFFSDGLPNLGKGLTKGDLEEIEKASANPTYQESLKGERLGLYLRNKIRGEWNKAKKVRIEAVGFFYESPDLGSFLWALARENGGNFIGMSKP